MLKKVILMVLLISATTGHSSWVDSDWTEPGVGCAAGAAVGYSISQPGAEMQNAALFCAFGATAGVVLNKYYENKLGRQYESGSRLLREQLKAHQIRQATDAALGIDSNLSIRREVIPGAKRADGTLTAPTIQYELDQAGSGLLLGD